LPPEDLDGSALSPDELGDAIRCLRTAAWIRLTKASRYFSRLCGLLPTDLLQEAFVRALDGRRRCPSTVDVVKFLTDVMRSIASDTVKKLTREPKLLALNALPGYGEVLDPADQRRNAEECQLQKEEVKQMKQALIDLFAHDPEAQTIVEGDMEGIKGEDLRLLTDLDSKDFATKRRLIRRTIDKAYPNGWPS